MLRVSWQSEYASIRKFSPVTIPDFTIIFGRNGAGKSQLLAAAAMGNVRVSDENDIQLSVSQYAFDFHQQNPFTFVPVNDDISPIILSTYATSAIMTDGSIFNLLSQIFDPKILLRLRRFAAPTDLIDLVSSKIRGTNKDFKNQLNDLVLQSVINTFQNSPMHANNQPLMQYVHSRPNLFDESNRKKHIGLVGKKSSDFNRPMVGQLFYDYWKKFKDHREQIELRELTDFSYDYTDADFIAANGAPPWEIYQSWINQLGLTLELSVPSLDSDTYNDVSILKKDVDQPIHPSQLSSGELVYLNIALSTLVSSDGMLAVSPPNVLLLDEPDAHLHPALCHELIHKILLPLSNDQKVRIIMTTHSPTTVSVGPEGSIYEKVNLSGLLKRDRQQAVNALMYGLSHVSLDPSGRRQVFVESKFDQSNYSLVYDLVHQEIQSDRSLSFISCGLSAGDAERNAGKDKVKDFVNRLRSAGNISVFGLIDFDNEKQDNDAIFTLTEEAYGIENVVLNPLAIGLLFLKAQPSAISGMTFTKSPFDSVSRDDIVRFIESRLGLPTENRKAVKMLGGFDVAVSDQSILMQCHSYEERVFEKIPELRKFAHKKIDLVGAVIREVFTEHPSTIPMWLVDTFKSICQWEEPMSEN